MHYTLYLGAASDDKLTAYSWLLVSYKGILASDVFLTSGERRFDEYYCGHVALQRALRKVAQQEGVIQLKVMLESDLANVIGFELLEVKPPLYPTLCRTTQRIMQRFDKCEVAEFNPSDSDASPQEVAVIDDAIDALEQVKTPRGQWSYWKDRITGSRKIIK